MCSAHHHTTALENYGMAFKKENNGEKNTVVYIDEKLIALHRFLQGSSSFQHSLLNSATNCNHKHPGNKIVSINYW